MKPIQPSLKVTDHDRASAGMTYVYPVVSRRAGGVSVGINLNPNNACNWRCIYCQVPDLKRGSAPPIDLRLLEKELREFLDLLVNGDFMRKRVPDDMRRINDIALSGNGEPTSAAEFEQVIALVGRLMREFGLLGKIKLVLITNGSLMHRGHVKHGVRQMAALNGEVWFKIDSATPEGIRRINGSRTKLERVHANLLASVELCPTWIQTCLFALDGEPPSQSEQAAYLSFLAGIRQEAREVQGVLLYGLARPSMQPEAERLSVLPRAWLDEFAKRIEALGLAVKVSC